MSRSHWSVVSATFLCLFVGASSLLVFTLGNYMRAWGAEFGWSRGLISAAYSVSAISMVVTTPIFGYLIDRFGIRRITLPGICIAAAAIAALALNNGTSLLLFVLYTLSGALTVPLTALPYSKAISNHFEKRRGLALGIATFGGSVGAAIVPQVVQHVIDTHGWREAYLASAVAVLVIGFVPAFFLLSDGVPTAAPGLDQVTVGYSAAEGRRQWRLWAICLAFLLAVSGASGTVTQIVPLLVDRGFDAQSATRMLAVFATGSAVARIFGGAILDYFFAPFVAAVCFVSAGIGISLFAWSSGLWMIILGTFLCGVSIGIEYDLLPFIISRYVGMRAYGELVGYAYMAFVLGTGMVGPLTMGYSYTYFHTYHPALVGFSILMLCAAALMLTIGKYRFPAPSEDKRLTPIADLAKTGLKENRY
ncbi:MFS transporter [Paraburkholderia strydomiana]|uniref:MFS transporter n=1 Tax=Paraburkholderia strydomiana TaxID=1245417 RepID=UPI00285812D9|nr:MFS transporter [Paraburkholderia strydomiana]MDR7009631.1 MFS family permease [Paraburkholderia strydomiana]